MVLGSGFKVISKEINSLKNRDDRVRIKLGSLLEKFLKRRNESSETDRVTIRYPEVAECFGGLGTSTILAYAVGCMEVRVSWRQDWSGKGTTLESPLSLHVGRVSVVELLESVRQLLIPLSCAEYNDGSVR
ncbi:hypothetical protein RJT34_07778 [Clitoria ternatea]|uniref:Uncharacterized protein n=1 Tax=Clitoria ternatea TaxID=43366 RepID=A0AAN9K6X3_CLITE